jgi:predicted nucleotidyltransferase
VGRPGLEPGTYGLKVRLPAAPVVLAAQDVPPDARNALNAQDAQGGVSTTVSTGADFTATRSFTECSCRVRRTCRASGGCLRITGGILHVMQAPAPPLLPLLRSRLQADLLALVLLSPGREWSLTELAERAGGSVSSAQREMARAEDAGVVSSRRLGSTRLVTASPSPLTGSLTELLLRSFGPRQVVAEEFAALGGVESVYLFGSWAARYAGQPGPPPADIDVLVIGRPDRDEAYEAAQRAAERLAREVNVTIRSGSWWREGSDGFHAEVTRRPIFTVLNETALT